jgi:hypothetical protein
MTRDPVRGVAGGVALAVALLSSAGCAHTGRARAHKADGPGTPVDSATVALYRMDETGGVLVADSGPSRLDGRAGPETRTIFGRYRGARLFTQSNNSFVYVPYRPALESPIGLTIEAWVAPNAYSRAEDALIAARWLPATADYSWLFGIVGLKVADSPQSQRQFVSGGASGRLMFTYQPDQAGPPRTFFSSVTVVVQRWTHVAVTFDGEVVTFWVDGQPQGTYATSGTIRASQAPLLIGNYFDTRFLSDFGGDLRQGPAADTGGWYALDGGLDELRISNVARKRFPLYGS